MMSIMDITIIAINNPKIKYDSLVLLSKANTLRLNIANDSIKIGKIKKMPLKELDESFPVVNHGNVELIF